MAPGRVIASQSRQLNFSRTVSMTLNRRGISSSVAVTSSPSLDSLLPPQHGQFVGAAIITRSRSMLSGNGLRIGRRRWGERAPCVFVAAFAAAISSSVAAASSSSSSSSICSSNRALRSERVP